ncbi:MAG: hypothetical protein K2M48_05040, partial [Clostridiales bacterium]|nr:hypothetical protein [Clostridiales bacterium]
PPVKVSDGIDFEVATGKSKNLTVADNITVNAYAPSAASDSQNATATIAQGLLTVTGVSEGSATVTLSCGEITVTFGVSVFAEYTVTVDGVASYVRKGEKFTLPEAPAEVDDDFDFVGWNVDGEVKQPNEEITVEKDLTITAELERKAAEKVKDGVTVSLLTVGSTSIELNVSEYITTHGNDVSASSQDGDTATAVLSAGKLTITAVAVGNTTVTLTCGDVTVEFVVSVASADENAPVFKNGSISFDLYEKTSASYDFEIIAPEGTNFTYAYTVTPDDGVLISGNTLTYTATEAVSNLVLSVAVTATDPEIGTKTTSFTVTVNVIDTTEYRLTNGGFDDGLVGWTKVGEIGNISSATAYWTNENDGAGYSFNADGKFFSAYEPSDMFEKNMGTLTSSTFKVSQNRVITFKLGGARHDIFVDIVDSANGAIIARYGNSAWTETTGGLKSGCTLIAYKATLPESAVGKTVYIRIIDAASSNYGVLFCDSFVTYYDEAPASGFIDAVDIEDRPATIYDVYNGGFESDMAGWAISGGDIGAITSDNGYWNNGNAEDTTNSYNKEGDKLFSWWSWDSEANEGKGGEVNREGNMGTLTGAPFILKNDNFVSFMLGGENRNIFVELVNAENGTIIAVFNNANEHKAGGRLIRYHYQVTGLEKDTQCYFRVVDNATSGWGCFTADGFK